MTTPAIELARHFDGHTVRNRLKGGMEAIPTERSDLLRKMILEIEVKSEHVEQIALAAAANIAAYFRRHGFTPDAEDAGHVATVLGPAFPEIGRAALVETFRAAATA